MSKKSIEECTDKELEKAIKLYESEIEKDKKTKYPNKELIKGIKRKKKYLKKLYKGRNRRIKKEIIPFNPLVFLITGFCKILDGRGC